MLPYCFEFMVNSLVRYLTNQVAPTEISADELSEVVPLQGMNNLGLVGFELADFA